MWKEEERHILPVGCVSAPYLTNLYNLKNENHYENSKQQTIDKMYLPTMVMTSTSASVEANFVTFILKNLLSKDVMVTFVADTELYFT